MDQNFGPSQEGEEDFQEKIFRRLVMGFLSVKIYFYIKCK